MVQVEWDDDSIDPSEIDQTVTDLKIVTSSCLSTVVHMQHFSFNMLTVLHVSRVGLQSLAGVCQLVMPSLKELYCSFNFIEDLDPLFGYYGLELIDLEGNRIKDTSNMIVLTTLPKLRELDLTDNPIAEHVNTLLSSDWFKSNIPSLLVANDVFIEDGRPVTTSTTCSLTSSTARVQTDLVIERARTPDTARRPRIKDPKILLPSNEQKHIASVPTRITTPSRGLQSKKSSAAHQPVRAVHLPRLKK